MEPSIPDLDIDVPEISQVAFVVEDLRDGMERFGSILGIGPWEVYRFEPPDLTNTTYRGEEREYSMLLGFAGVGDLKIELIEPLEGESIYTEHLEAHGEGLHHIACFAYDDPRAVVRSFEDAGIPVLQSGSFKEGWYWYFDTQDHLNGLIFETAEPITPLLTPDWTYPE